MANLMPMRYGVTVAVHRRRRSAHLRQMAAETARWLIPFTAGALMEHYVLDRRHAARRRHMARERALGALRRRSRHAMRRARYLEGVAHGTAYRAAHAMPGVGGHKEPLDDTSLAQKVESIAFRTARVPKDHVSVNVEHGVVYLRGQLRDEQIGQLVRATEAIDGVKGVKSLLHAPTASDPTAMHRT